MKKEFNPSIQEASNFSEKIKINTYKQTYFGTGCGKKSTYSGPVCGKKNAGPYWQSSCRNVIKPGPMHADCSYRPPKPPKCKLSKL